MTVDLIGRSGIYKAGGNIRGSLILNQAFAILPISTS